MKFQSSRKRLLLSILLCAAMVFTLLPTAAFAEEPTADGGEAVPAVCTCENKCSEGNGNSECEICKADSSACAAQAPAPEPQPPQAAPAAPEDVPACTCTEKCTGDAVNAECPVCAGGFDKCTFEEAAPAPDPIAALQARIGLLPTVGEFFELADDAQQAAYQEAAEIDAIYQTLTRDERAQLDITKAEKLLQLFSVGAFALTPNTTDTPEQLVHALLGEGITATNVSSTGTVYSVSDAMSELGMAAGVTFDTSGNPAAAQDLDLAALISAEGKSYGGSGESTHTSTLQFTMTATGTLLNFNYIFTSCEFDQSAWYNDIFGLFVSVNGGAFENIAKLDNGKHITITNLRAGRDGTQLSNGTGTDIGAVGTKYDYFAVTNFGMPNGGSQNCNGVTPVFNAQKEVSIGDTVTAKFAIADVGDTGYNAQTGRVHRKSDVYRVNSGRQDYNFNSFFSHKRRSRIASFRGRHRDRAEYAFQFSAYRHQLQWILRRCGAQRNGLLRGRRRGLVRHGSDRQLFFRAASVYGCGNLYRILSSRQGGLLSCLWYSNGDNPRNGNHL